MAALADRAAAGAADPELGDLARLVRGQVDAEAGRSAEAEAAFRALLDAARGSGRRIGRLAAVSLARLFARQGRPAEALVLARAAAAAARKAAHPFDLALARSRVCMALLAMGDVARLAPALDELERGLGGIAPERAAPLRTLVHGFRAESALEGGDLEGARAALDALRALAADGAAPPAEPRLLPWLEGEVALRSGDAPAALAAVERAREIPLPHAATEVPLLVLEARALLECGREGEAHRRLVAALDLLEDGAAGEEGIGSGHRIHWADQAGRILRDGLRAVPDARRAFDLAARWSLRRVVEVGRAARALPEMGGVAGEDLRALTDHRHRFLAAHAEIADRLAALYAGDAAPESLREPDPAGGDEGLFRACAWCRRVRDRGGAWLPLGEFLPDDRRLRVSHGICPDCRSRFAPGASR